MLKDLFAFVLTHFAIGLILTIPFVSAKEIGKFFFRVTTLTSAILLFGAVLARPFTDAVFAFGFASTAALAQSLILVALLSLLVYNGLLNRFHFPFLAMSGLTGLGGIIFYSIHLANVKGLSMLGMCLLVFSSVTSTLLLGSVLGAMITGHWYLVQHRLSIVPLMTSSRVYLIAVLLRGAVVGLTLGVTATTLSGYQQVTPLFNFDGIGYIFWGRLLFGLVAPLIFGFMTLSAVKIHSTQSATGILYATIVLVMLGEVFGRVLFFLTGVAV
jgi:hypothetical protein